MEGTNTTMVPAVGRGDTQVFQGNRLKLRVSVGGNEFELTDERAATQTASVNVQELIGAYTGLVKATTKFIPVNAQHVAENSVGPGTDIENKDVRVESMQLAQIIRKYDGEISDLRSLIQESKQDYEELKTRFRAATHMKAAELAQLLPQGDTVQNAADGRGLEGHTKLVEPFTPAHNATEIRLNAKVREIDIPNLEDVLGSDEKASVTFKRTANSLAMEDANVFMGNSETGSRAVPGDDERYFDRFATGISALNHATPPSVVKIGLDADLARAGGECRIDDSHGSPLRRSPPRRGRMNDFDSIVDQDFFMQTDEGRTSSRDIPGMVETYGIMHKPTPDKGDCHRAVRIGNLPEDIDYERLLAKVRGGRIISATLCNTTKIRGFGGHISALVVFMNAEAAKAYVQFANKHGICFGSQQAIIELIHTPSYPLSVQTEKRLSMSHTRYLLMPKCGSELSLAKIDRIINADVNGYRVEAMGKLWKDDYGGIHIRFASISAAGMAFARLIKDPYSNQGMPSFVPDPCGRPLSDLLPTPQGRKLNGFINMKVNYDDDKDDDKDVGDVKLKSVNQPAATIMRSVDGIELENSDQDNNTGEGKGTKSSQTDHEQEPKIDVTNTAMTEIKTVDEGKDVLKTSPELKTLDTAMLVDKKPAEVETGREIQDNTAPEISKAEVLPHTDHIPKLENSLVAEDSNVSESVASSPTIPRIAKPVSDEQSNIVPAGSSAANRGLDSQADKVHEAVETSTLKLPVDLNALLPHTNPVDAIGEANHPAIEFLPTIVKEEPLLYDPVEKDSVTDAVTVKKDSVIDAVTGTVTDTVAKRFKETQVVEAHSRATSVEQLATAETSATNVSVTVPPVGAIEDPSVSSPSTVSATSTDKYDLSDTGLDQNRLVYHGITTILALKPRGDLTSSMWAPPGTVLSPPIVIKAPQAPPTLANTLAEREKYGDKLLFGAPPAPTISIASQPVSLALSNAPKEPRASALASTPTMPDIKQKAPVKDQRAEIQKTLSDEASRQPSSIKETKVSLSPKPTPNPPSGDRPIKPPQGLATSRYASLAPEAPHDRPRSNIRRFYDDAERRGPAAKRS